MPEVTARQVGRRHMTRNYCSEPRATLVMVLGRQATVLMCLLLYSVFYMKTKGGGGRGGEEKKEERKQPLLVKTATGPCVWWTSTLP